MKKIIIVILAAIFLTSITAVVDAGYDEYKEKLKDGLATMVQSPIQMADSVKEEYGKATFKPFGVFGGLLKGSFYTGKELAQGLLRVLTFNLTD